MGLNVNLRHMLGLKTEEGVTCPACKKVTSCWDNDYDIDDSHTNPEPGIWVLRRYCDHCEHEWQDRYVLEAHPELDPKDEASVLQRFAELDAEKMRVNDLLEALFRPKVEAALQAGNFAEAADLVHRMPESPARFLLFRLVRQ